MTTKSGNDGVRVVRTLEALGARGIVRAMTGGELWWVTVTPPIGMFSMFHGRTLVDAIDDVREAAKAAGVEL